jgi:poly-gamma-glutamate synthesis protein (capsule biosynthesis protein)
MKNKKALIFYALFILIVLTVLSYIGYEVYKFTTIKSDNILNISKPDKTVAKPITFTIGGDAMLGRAIAWKWGNDVTQAFTDLGENYFSGVDLGILNLEGPISGTDFKANPNPDNLIFNFPPQSIDALKYLGVNTVSSANNHSQNQGRQGLETTKQLLSAANIADLGSQTSFNEDNIKEYGKLTIIVVNLVGQEFDITDSIKSEKAKGQTILIFPHWGSEYQTTHSSSQSKYAHNWIDAGADIIIGSHPHVVQDAEIYSSKPIFYSLGNLIFDQSFSSETQHGLIIKGEINEKETKLTIIPTVISKYKVSIDEAQNSQNVIDKFKKDLPDATWQDNNLIINL